MPHGQKKALVSTGAKRGFPDPERSRRRGPVVVVVVSPRVPSSSGPAGVTGAPQRRKAPGRRRAPASCRYKGAERSVHHGSLRTKNESCLQDPRPASARRADQLADWSTAPRAFTLEQTPLIRGAVSASGCSQRDPGDRKEPRGKAWSPRNALSTRGRVRQVPLAPEFSTYRTCSTRRAARSSGQSRTGRAGAPLLAICWMCACTCMARCTHWSLLWYS